MPGFTNYLANKQLDHMTGKASFTMPTVHVALLTTNPTNNTGASLVETTYTNYARSTTSAATWNSAASGATDNAAVIAFPACGATGATIVGFALYDASTAGNLIAYGTCSLAVSSGITPQFAIGALDLTQT